jgi:hypothetical protein
MRSIRPGWGWLHLTSGRAVGGATPIRPSASLGTTFPTRGKERDERLVTAHREGRAP